MRLSTSLFGFAIALLAQQTTPVRTGPALGSTVPSFEAPDQNGRMQTLKSLTGPKGLLLVFYRSADW
jgi:hypothetical protein